MLTSCFVSIKKREKAKNAVDPRKHKVWARKLLTEGGGGISHFGKRNDVIRS